MPNTELELGQPESLRETDRPNSKSTVTYQVCVHFKSTQLNAQRATTFEAKMH